jgi:hypothetical protein
VNWAPNSSKPAFASSVEASFSASVLSIAAPPPSTLTRLTSAPLAPGGTVTLIAK